MTGAVEVEKYAVLSTTMPSLMRKHHLQTKSRGNLPFLKKFFTEMHLWYQLKKEEDDVITIVENAFQKCHAKQAFIQLDLCKSIDFEASDCT